MRTQNRPFRLTSAAAIAALLVAQALPQPVLAQGAPPPPPQAGVPDQQQGGDPPARVGRLAQLSGTVSFHPQDDQQWSPATLNYPVTQGDAFWTEPNARAVIEVSASRIAMAPGTELDVGTLTDSAFQATVPQGELYLNVRTAAPGETYAVQTPRGLVTFTAPGRYGVVAGDTQNPTTVTVVEGAARVEGPGVSLDVAANQTASVTGTDTFQGEVGPAQRDAFLTAMLDSERPPPPQGAAPPAIVAAMPGGDDLAQYGSWSDSSDYGQVWYPQVAPDWVPYREGSWAYVAPWGWTWVDSDPWGFAPFHYGRWVDIGGRWGWVPGAAPGVPAPVYAPALVTFLGVGAVVGVGIGAALAAGRIGWCPLGPREAYHPWYRASDRYFRQVNVSHVTNFTTINRNVAFNNFVNRRAVTVVPTSAMTASTSGGAFVPAAGSGAAHAGAAGHRRAAAAADDDDRRRDSGGGAAVAHAPTDRRSTSGLAGSGDPRHASGRHRPTGTADPAQSGVTRRRARGGRRTSLHRSTGSAHPAGTGSGRAAGDPPRADCGVPGRNPARASGGQSKAATRRGPSRTRRRSDMCRRRRLCSRRRPRRPCICRRPWQRITRRL